MRNLCVIADRDGEQRLAPVAVSARSGALNPAANLSLIAFQEEMTFSYFSATYIWAPFWKPLLQGAKLAGLDSTGYIGSKALTFSYMGHNYRDAVLESKGIELLGRTLRKVKGDLDQGLKSDIAKAAVPVLILGMYSVGCSKIL